MSEVDINYKNTKIAGMDASGTKTLLTEGKYCEDDIEVTYTRPAASLQTKSASYTPTESQQSAAITADNGYDGLDRVNVTVGAVSSSYVGSGITRRSSTDLTASGATVTAPSGYYASQATKSVQGGTVTAPSTISGTGATVSAGTNTLTLAKTISVTPDVSTAGWISSGTAGNSDVSLTASVPTKSAATFNVSSSTQTIDANIYLKGAQTLRPVLTSNIVADNIKSGVNVKVGDAGSLGRIKDIVGTFEGNIGTTTATATTTSITFNDIPSNPKTYIAICQGQNLTISKGSYVIAGVSSTNSSETLRVHYVNNGSSSVKFSTGSSYTNVSTAYNSTEKTFRIATSASTGTAPGRFLVGSYRIIYTY